MRVVFLGTPEFAAEVLSDLLASGIDVVAVISRTDKAKGRSATLQPTPVKIIAEQHGIPVYQPAKVSDETFLPTLHSFEADLFVVVAYGEILRQHVLDVPKLGCINLHASLLPKYRGAAPIQRAIMSGEKETGVTIMYLVRKMDAGDMIAQETIAIAPDETYGQLQNRLRVIGSQLLLRVLQDFKNGNITRTPQDEAKATLAHKLELEDTEIIWKLPSQEIYNLIRGVNPFPGAWTLLAIDGEKKRMKIHTAQTVDDRGGVPGSILALSAQGILVACGEGALLIQNLQLEGKKPMDGASFFAGYKDKQLSF